MQADAQAVIDRLSRQIAELSVRLAVAEVQIGAYQRAEVDRIAAEESADGDK